MEKRTQEQLITDITERDQQIKEKEQRVKVINENIKDIKESMNEFDEFEKAKNDLAVAKEKLNLALSEHPGYNDYVEARTELKHTLDSLKYIQSEDLVEYHAMTKDRQIPTSETEGREVILKGTLGKEQPIQESLFGSQLNIEVTNETS